MCVFSFIWYSFFHSFDEMRRDQYFVFCHWTWTFFSFSSSSLYISLFISRLSLRLIAKVQEKEIAMCHKWRGCSRQSVSICIPFIVSKWRDNIIVVCFSLNSYYFQNGTCVAPEHVTSSSSSKKNLVKIPSTNIFNFVRERLSVLDVFDPKKNRENVLIDKKSCSTTLVESPVFFFFFGVYTVKIKTQ